MKLCFSVTLAQRQDFHYRKKKKMHTVYSVGVQVTGSVPRIVSVPPPHSRAVVDISLQSIHPDPIPLSCICPHLHGYKLCEMLRSSARVFHAS